MLDAQFNDWMRGTPDQAAEMIKPYAGEIQAWEVGPTVGNVRNNRPRLMDRVGCFRPKGEGLPTALRSGRWNRSPNL